MDQILNFNFSLNIFIFIHSLSSSGFNKTAIVQIDVKHVHNSRHKKKISTHLFYIFFFIFLP